MLRSFLVLFVFCVACSVGEYADYMDYIISLNRENFTVCGKKEVYVCATPTCPRQKTCKTRQEQIDCTVDLNLCDYECFCGEGLFRNVKGGECVSEQQCDKCPDPNEHFACGGPCDNICHTLHLQNRTSCPHTYTECHPSCYCDDGYARDDDGACIPFEDCNRENIV